MGIKGAISELERRCEFFGMKFDDLIFFIERAPYAHTDRTIQAYNIYKREYFLNIF